MPVRIWNKSSESRCPSKYQNSLRSDHPLVSYKYLIFFLIFPLPLAPQMVESGKTTLSSQIVQLFDTPTNFHRPSTSRSTKLAESLNPSPQILQRERIQYDSVNHVSRTFVYSIHQASSRFLHSKCFFQDFPLQLPPMTKDLVGIWNKSSETWIPSKNQISLRSDHLFIK